MIRPATPADTPAMGVLGARLVRLHVGFDPRRFFAPGAALEEGYRHFLASQLDDDRALVLVATIDGAVAGYLYGSVEPRSWEALRDVCGFVHDVIVDEAFRGRGVASRLMEAAVARFAERGLPRVLLHTAEQNVAAQRLFAALGFRRTMIEMTREIDPAH